MISVLFSRIFILVFATLYPGYMSFKTVRVKAVDDYVKWMMYWIVFAIFTASETITDIFLSWLPLYYELKVVLVLWLLPTLGDGSTFVYKRCIHPLLEKHETHVDYQLEQFREKGQDLLLHYIRVAVLYIGKLILNIINKNCPNSILGLIAKNNNNISDNAGYVQVTNNIIIEEEDVQYVPKKSANKKLPKSLAKNVDSVEPRSSDGCTRRLRKTKSDMN